MQDLSKQGGLQCEMVIGQSESWIMLKHSQRSKAQSTAAASDAVPVICTASAPAHLGSYLLPHNFRDITPRCTGI